MQDGQSYLPEWGVRIEIAGDSGPPRTGIGQAPNALAALRAVLEAHDLDPQIIERIEVFRVRDIGGPEL